METGYKHFSHAHNLVLHEMPDGAEVSCSGCKSSAIKTIYICWQCNFYLHEQCFHATRSLKHPSHSLHPLTLVPYPTYPSNSFYCNSCKIIGTGFSYSCSDCDFDLHVQCGYSISVATTLHQPNPVITPQPPNISYPNHEVVSMVPNVTSVPNLNPNPYHGQHPIYINQGSYMAQNVSTFFVPSSAQNSVPSAPNEYISQSNFTSVPPSAHNSSISQHISNVFVPTNGETSQNKPNNQGIKHFSHPHDLVLVNLKHGNKQIACSGCQQTIVGDGFKCVEENCSFYLDHTCFYLDTTILLKSHPAHPLELLSSSPYSHKFTCDACFKDGSGFLYNCSICKYDLHVKCANLREAVMRDDHEHVLKLIYDCPLKDKDYNFLCSVCNEVGPWHNWTYYCKECDYGTHLECVDRKVCYKNNRDEVAHLDCVDPEVRYQSNKVDVDYVTAHIQRVQVSMNTLGSIR